jgi:hypothetical protein
MFALEFEASIANGVVRIPDHYQHILDHKKARFVVLVNDELSTQVKPASFDPRLFFGAANASKQSVDQFLLDSASNWA